MMIAMYCLSVSRNNYMKMNYRRELKQKQHSVACGMQISKKKISVSNS